MAGGVDIGVTSGGLDEGADVAAGAAGGMDAVVIRLSGVAVAPAVLGQVDQAGFLVAALGGLVDAAREVGQRVSQRHTDLAQRARATARQADGMVRDTTGVAAGAVLTPVPTPSP